MITNSGHNKEMTESRIKKPPEKVAMFLLFRESK